MAKCVYLFEVKDRMCGDQSSFDPICEGELSMRNWEIVFEMKMRGPFQVTGTWLWYCY
jgi:hypothetical protein